jgi:hypothetical protein
MSGFDCSLACRQRTAMLCVSRHYLPRELILSMAIFTKRSLLIICGASVALACGGGQSEPQTPPPAQYPPAQGQYPAGQYPQQPQQQYPQQQYPQQPQQPYPAQPQQPYPTAPAPAPTGAAPAAPALPGIDPSVLGGAPAGPQATPIDPAAAAAVQPILNSLATSKALAGAKPIGSVMAANFQQGQQLEQQVQMEPGKCYTVVAAGLPPAVTELNIQLVAVTPLPGTAPVLAVDNTTGAQAVLGEKPNCYKWAWPIAAPVKVVVSVAGGAGLAAAQLYAK